MEPVVITGMDLIMAMVPAVMATAQTMAITAMARAMEIMATAQITAMALETTGMEIMEETTVIQLYHLKHRLNNCLN